MLFLSEYDLTQTMCQISRREWLKLASMMSVAGAAPLLTAAAARAAAEPDAPLRIGYLPITDATPLLVAHANGYFEQAGIQADKPTLLRIGRSWWKPFWPGRSTPCTCSRR